MTPLIQRLSETARHLASNKCSHLERMHNRTLGLDEQATVYSDCFAELLIKECAAQCNPQPGLKYSPNSLSSRNDCKNNILGLLDDN